MEAATGNMMRLPEELLAEIISLTSPSDACRAAAVSRAFLAAADSDAVWSRFLPRDLPRLIGATQRSLMVMELPSYKAQFIRLSGDPFLLLDVVMMMWEDEVTGGKCYPARALNISLGDEQKRWHWILGKYCKRNSNLRPS